jgi:solute carrier family 25 phosphate transporter 3
LTASASAEFFADIALCPFEAVKVRMQTTMPPFASGTFDGISKITAKEGTAGLYKGLYPLWGRQVSFHRVERRKPLTYALIDSIHYDVNSKVSI